MKLTYKNKKPSNDEKREIEILKRQMISIQEGLCFKCHKPFTLNLLPEMSHIISKADRNITMFSYEVIHHRLNVPICCSKCNSSVMINRSKKILIAKHLIPIKDDLKLKGYDVAKLEKQIYNLLNGKEP